MMLHKTWSSGLHAPRSKLHRILMTRSEKGSAVSTGHAITAMRACTRERLPCMSAGHDGKMHRDLAAQASTAPSSQSLSANSVPSSARWGPAQPPRAPLLLRCLQCSACGGVRVHQNTWHGMVSPTQGSRRSDPAKSSH